jgi:hypothetical protein
MARDIRLQQEAQPKIRIDENGDPQLPKKKKNRRGKKSTGILDESIMENLATRVTLTKTLKVLCPTAAFVISQHACKSPVIFMTSSC